MTTGEAAPVPAAERDLVTWAVELTREAGLRTLHWFRSEDLRVETKDDGTPVTEADHDAEAYIRAQLDASRPDDAVIGEEHGAGDKHGSGERRSGMRWIVDPIDGTKAFLRGVPLYANLLAAEDEHGWCISVVNLPATGECVYAGRGLGAYHLDRNGDPRPARVATERSPMQLLCSSGFSNWDPGALARVVDDGWSLRTWGDGYGFAMVATGRADAMVDPEAALWDLAPMPLLLAEAGGRFSALDGLPDPAAGSGVATNGTGHDELLDLLGPRAARTS